MKFTKDSINIEPAKEFEKISSKLKEDVIKKLKKRGAVVGISGGIDSSVVLAICARTFGSDRVLGVMMPENDSNPDSLNLAKKLSAKFNTKYVVENMTDALAGFGCYKRRDDAIKDVFPEYNNSYKAKITLPSNLLEKESLNVFQLTIIAPDGKTKSERLPLKEYLQIVAASNFKQRSRMSMLYYHAESRNYAVIGTGNKNEHEQGFFVKYGDGGADIKPIAHLFKTQVFQLADYLEVPEEIRKRTPTTDTYSAEQTQEEFFFRVPFGILDRIWFGWEQGIPSKKIAEVLELTEENVDSIIRDTQRKIRTTEYLRMEPL
ncbi:MAG: NAD(+) synthase [Ignavibacteriota bacterium]|nr:NAD(+) synthase [Ignavibacteriales bacterium]QKJ98212.1 MAG: NAD(+) synthase [Ignavibacteriota bacterium]HOJ07514.1 NAD(+) synthase [Ignavibacteriaceae bacterium]